MHQTQRKEWEVPGLEKCCWNIVRKSGKRGRSQILKISNKIIISFFWNNIIDIITFALELTLSSLALFITYATERNVYYHKILRI